MLKEGISHLSQVEREIHRKKHPGFIRRLLSLLFDPSKGNNNTKKHIYSKAE
ncbi:MAG: hypothetical protein PHU71_01535 [Candidatus Gracilibacteria bacterium]|nr:hypothetical protein [Candidatus Gracilibacteria bacterium]